jgi:hypothetical protein
MQANLVLRGTPAEVDKKLWDYEDVFPFNSRAAISDTIKLITGRYTEQQWTVDIDLVIHETPAMDCVRLALIVDARLG